MIVKWFHIFSVWIFIASTLYLIGISPINTFPLNALVLIPGIYQFLYRFGIDPIWKLVNIALLHLLPFTVIPVDLTKRTIMYNFFILAAYVAYMLITKNSITDVYQTLITEEPVSFTQFIMDRWSL
jgi:hypothetical protein